MIKSNLINNSTDRNCRSSDEQIAKTYEQLGLNDPEVREFYENLRSLTQQNQPEVWLRTSHHSSVPKE